MKRMFAAALVMAAITLASCGNKVDSAGNDPAETPAAESVTESIEETTTEMTTDESIEAPGAEAAQATPQAASNGDAIVKITTSKGPITVRLYGDTPRHRDNFVRLAREGFYDGLLFHRVISNFMIQAGDPDSRNAAPGQMLGSGDPGYTIPAEIFYPRHFHKHGALAAARTGDAVNPERASSGSQFYIVTGEVIPEQILNQYESRNGVAFTPEQRRAYTTIGGTPHLDGEYTVFGEVIDGMGVVEAIEHVPTGRADRPIDDVRIVSMEVLQ